MTGVHIALAIFGGWVLGVLGILVFFHGATQDVER